VKIEYEGRAFDFDILRLTTEECEAIEKFTGARGMGDWNNQLAVANTKAFQALWWAMRRHAGENPGPVAVRDPALLPLLLNNAYGTALEAELAAQEAAQEEEPDPTRPPAASSPASAGTTTTPASAAPPPSLPG
jgi:hypothetical protein